MTTTYAPTAVPVHTNGHVPSSATDRIAAHILSALDAIDDTPGAVFELSVGRKQFGKVVFDKGFFADRHALATEAAMRTQRAEGKAVYVNLQRIAPDCLHRAHNKMSQDAQPMRAADVVRYVNFLIDVDRAGVKDISATEAEKLEIQAALDAMREFLLDQGWPDPKFDGDSGNGRHLCWKIDLPVAKENQGLLKRCYQALNQKFGSDVLTIDESLADPNQLIKLYGTKARKGDDTAERPHRYSRLLHVYETEPVTRAQLEALASLYQEPAKTAADKKPKATWRAATPEAVEEWADGHKLKLGERRQERDKTGTGYKWTVDCLTSDEHSDGAALILNSAGYLNYRCHHNSCNDKRIADVLAKYPQSPTVTTGDDGDDFQEFTSDKSGKSEKPKQGDELYALALKQATFFQGRQDGQLYASVAVDGHRECYRMKSERFNDWLSHAYFQQSATVVSSAARDAAKSLLAFEARKCVEDVFVRVGHHDGKIYIDTGNAQGEAIEVDALGWRIVAIPPVHFRRPETLLPLVTPVEHKDPLILRQYLNIESEDWPLLAAWVVAALHPRGPYPVLAFLSRAGSAKSTQLRLLKRIIDPSAAELRIQLSDVRDLFIAAANSWILAFDNVSQISSEVSDALCVIATGGGFTRKANYTDQEESVINVQRPILLNGIGDVIARQDLMDRSIVIGTPYIPEEKRIDEEAFWQGVERDKPKILGAFLYALSHGLANINTVTLERKPRMADFAKLAVAAESAYIDPSADKGFMAVYAENRDRAADTIVENSPVGEVLLRVMGSADSLEETPQDLFLKMETAAKDYEKKADGWPKHHNQLKEALERIAPALDRLGIRCEAKRTKEKRLLRAWKVATLLD